MFLRLSQASSKLLSLVQLKSLVDGTHLIAIDGQSEIMFIIFFEDVHGQILPNAANITNSTSTGRTDLISSSTKSALAPVCGQVIPLRQADRLLQLVQ